MTFTILSASTREKYIALALQTFRMMLSFCTAWCGACAHACVLTQPISDSL